MADFRREHLGRTVLALRKLADTTEAPADLTYGPLQLDADGNLKVNVKVGGGGGVGGGDASAANQVTQTALLTDIESAVDGLETAVAATNTKLDTVITHVDGLEALIGTTNTNVAAVSAQRSGAGTGAQVTATGSSQTIIAAGAKWWLVYNNSDTTWWLNIAGGTAAVGGAGCFPVPAGTGYEMPGAFALTNAITGISTVAKTLETVRAA